MFGIPTQNNASPHNPAFTACAGTDEAHTEAIVVGKSLALIGWEMITNDEMYYTARQQWQVEVERDD